MWNTRHRPRILWLAAVLAAAALLCLRACQRPGERPESGLAVEPPRAEAGLVGPHRRLGGLEAELGAQLDGAPGSWSYYIEDLSSGGVAARAADQLLPAASTRKLPLVMLVLEQAAAGRLSLDEEMTYRAADRQDGTGILQARPLGSRFSVRLLAELAITHSDNVAARMLTRRVGYDALLAYVQEVGGAGEERDELTLLTPRALGRCLRAVWDGERLTPAHREMLLSWMVGSVFTDRLRAGTPAEIPVAHKIGTLGTSAHDAGIVLHPGRPYIIVVMSQGLAPEEAARWMAQVARTAYKHLTDGA